MAAKKTTAQIAEPSPILNGPYAEPGQHYVSVDHKRIASNRSALDVVRLLAEMPDEVFDAIGELQSAEERHGLSDDKGDDA